MYKTKDFLVTIKIKTYCEEKQDPPVVEMLQRFQNLLYEYENTNAEILQVVELVGD